MWQANVKRRQKKQAHFPLSRARGPAMALLLSRSASLSHSHTAFSLIRLRKYREGESDRGRIDRGQTQENCRGKEANERLELRAETVRNHEEFLSSPK